jgi:hypothetical protein
MSLEIVDYTHIKHCYNISNYKAGLSVSAFMLPNSLTCNLIMK